VFKKHTGGQWFKVIGLLLRRSFWIKIAQNEEKLIEVKILISVRYNLSYASKNKMSQVTIFKPKVTNPI